MKRRDFLRNTSFSVVALSTTGFITFNGKNFTGDCETTSDILGPFYRPNSPVRNNLHIAGEIGNPIELNGYIRHSDCSRPFANAKIELWHCDGKGVYDNTSEAFRYRGTAYSNQKGYYSFTTVYPVPYEAGAGVIRPAHFHLMITAAGYKPLVTQLYFAGDPHLKSDPYSSSEKAKSRILQVKKENELTRVRYDVGLPETLDLEAAALEKLVGVYGDVENKNRKVELFNFNNQLWMKNEAFGNKFQYIGNNTFEEPDNPKDYFWTLKFNFQSSGVIRLNESFVENDRSVKSFVYEKFSK
jgi:catechol 1,2-dioxygenase